MRIYFFIVLTCITMVLFSCADHGGIGHEGEARITGQLILTDGTSASQTRVELFPQDYDPVKKTGNVTLEMTNAQGAFEFSRVAPGQYTVYAVHNKNRTKVLISGIEVLEDSTVEISTHVLQKSGAMKVFFPSSIQPKDGYVYIPGTKNFAYINSQADFVVIDSVPPGIIPEVAYSAEDEVIPQTLRYNVSVRSNDSAIVFNSTWKYCCQLVLNTTVSGAAVSSNVINFPVCIKLTSNNFAFDQARADGADVRFSKMDNTALPYEIEYWDTDKKLAAVWVNIDTVFGNNDSQSVMMYWGSNDATSESNSAAVFDTANGYTGVWHLNRQSTDASHNKNNGILCSASDTTGVIGLCKRFNGSDSVLIPGLLGSQGSITLSAWAQLDSTITGGGSDILSIGDAVLIRMDYEKDSLGTIGSIHVSEGTYFTNTSSNRFYKKSGWHLVTFIIDQSNLTRALYIDGQIVNLITNTNVAINYTGVGKNTYIGKHANGKANFGFIGRIDEVRVHQGAVSADYIKLSYMNQKEKDALVTFRKN